MRFISVDIEYDPEQDELVQIGAVAWDTDDGELGRFNKYMKGKFKWEQLLKGNEKTLGELLPYGQELIDEKGQDPSMVLAEFWTWVQVMRCGKRMVQWGTGDMSAIFRHSKRFGVSPERYRTIDAKSIYQSMIQPALHLPKYYGLGSAIKLFLKRPFEGSQHDAFWDAYNTALVYNKMFSIVEKYGRMSHIIKGE